MPFINRVIILFFLTSSYVLGQNFFEKIKYRAESGVYLSTSGKNPFLVRANQYGIVPLESSILTVRGSASKDYDSTFNSLGHLNKFGFGFGVNAVANVGKVNQVLLPEAYLKVRFGAFELYGGRRREIVGLVDTVLTSGSYIWSGNALPMPKIQIAIPNYTPILGKGLLSIKGAYSHGWFDNGAVRNFYLHQKYIYARIGKPNWKIKLYSGFNHQVQWGGRPATPYVDKTTGTLVTKYPSDFNTYLNVITGASLNKGDNGLATSLPGNEALNRAGNHLGSIDIATEISFKKFDILLYRQSIYDDGSLFYLNNIEDGLLGVSFKKKAKGGITGICFEYLDTRNQGGNSGSENTIPQLRGQDSYFNNQVYSESWSYNENIIGTPLFTQINTINKGIIKNNLEKQSPNYIINNRVQAFYISFEGRIKNAEYITKVVFSNNLGTYFIPLDAKQFAFLLRLNYKFPKFSISSFTSFDKGQLSPNSLGVYLGIQRTFL